MTSRLFQRFFLWNILVYCLSVLAFGCSDSSEWDVQWKEITEAMQAGEGLRPKRERFPEIGFRSRKIPLLLRHHAQLKNTASR